MAGLPMDFFVNVLQLITLDRQLLSEERGKLSTRADSIWFSRASISFLAVNPSSNHSVRPCQHVRRYCQADLLGGFEIDHQLELGRLLDWKFRGLRAFENFVNVESSPPV
jgi:hypothetical protein